MSPLGQLSSYLGNHRGIDRDFNHVLSYVDEVDRHFSHRHHLVNCVVPRFDLEEDSRSTTCTEKSPVPNQMI
jgi:hypothetical protein